jgi:hypothetical protein
LLKKILINTRFIKIRFQSFQNHNFIKYITKNRLVSKEDLILKPEDYEFFTKIKKFSLSDTNSEGEGEMKIYDIINQLDIKQKDTVLFYSPDSDVILLSMISKYSENII